MYKASMEDAYSPQLCDVEVDLQNKTAHRSCIGDKPSFASLLNGNHSAEPVSKLELCPVSFENGTPTIEFTVDEVNQFTREEGLYQAVVIKFSYEKHALQDLRQILPKHFDVKGKCNVGQLEYRHILVRFDLFEDFANVVPRTSGYVQSKGDEFFLRTFPWTMGFNPREESPKAVVWISFPDLPANLFARKSLMSIASAVGKPLAIDKATKDRTRPITARVKILINLLDKHPKRIKIKILDIKSEKLLEYDQQIVIDNLPKYCTYCNHQGHDVKSCRWNTEDLNEKAVHVTESEGRGRLDNSGRDAREFLNELSAGRRCEVVSISENVATTQQTESVLNYTDAVSLPSQKAVHVQQCTEKSTVILQLTSNVLAEKKMSNKPSVTSQVSKRAYQQAKEIEEKGCDSGDELIKIAQHNALLAEAGNEHQNAVVISPVNQGIVKDVTIQNGDVKTAQTSVMDKNVADQHLLSKPVVVDDNLEASHIASPVQPMNKTTPDGINSFAQADQSDESDENHFKCNVQQQQSTFPAATAAKILPKVVTAQTCLISATVSLKQPLNELIEIGKQQMVQHSVDQPTAALPPVTPNDNNAQPTDNRQKNGQWSMANKAVTPKSKNKNHFAGNNPSIPSTSNSFSTIANSNDDEGELLEEKLQIGSIKHTDKLTLSSEKDQECDQNNSGEVYEDPIKQKCQGKSAMKNCHTLLQQTATPNSNMNCNAPLFVPRTKAVISNTVTSKLEQNESAHKSLVEVANQRSPSSKVYVLTQQPTDTRQQSSEDGQCTMANKAVTLDITSQNTDIFAAYNAQTSQSWNRPPTFRQNKSDLSTHVQNQKTRKLPTRAAKQKQVARFPVS